MPLPPNFPTSPHELLFLDSRWAPDTNDMFWGKLPPLVENLYKKVNVRRDDNDKGASQTSLALPDWKL